MYFPEGFLKEVQERTDLVEVISSYIPLRKSGRNFKALCPFHHEKTPSFMVNQEKQIYHCFGCGAGGDVFNFIMKYEKLEFPEAVKELAEKSGLKIPESSGENRASNKDEIYRVNSLAADFFHSNLINGGGAEGLRQYLINRGVDRKSWEEFKLGFAPDSWDVLLKHLLSKGMKKEILIQAGLARVSEEGKCYDWFRNRLTFPVTDMRGRVLGFGARLIEDSTSKNDFQPKYINTRETEVFSKGNILFGMNMTANAVRDAKEAILVEGYMDTIVLFQHGVCNVVSVSGTALTPEQARLLHRYTEKLVMLYDGDAAGESANLRGMEVGWEEGLDVKVACLPPGDDPDEYVIKYGKDGLLEKVSGAEDFFDYRFRLLLKQYGGKDISQKLKVCHEMWPSISRIKNLIGRSEYIKKLAEKLSLKEQDVMKEFIRSRKSVKTRFAPGQPEEIKHSFSEGNGVMKAERMLTAIMLEETWRARDVKKILTPEDFQSPDMCLLAEEIFRMADNEQEVPAAAVISSLRDRVDPGVISALLLEAGEIIDREKTMEDCIKKVKGWPKEKRRAELPLEINHAKKTGNHELAKSLLVEYSTLIKSRG